MERNVSVRFATREDSNAISNILRDAFTVYREHYTPEAFAIVTPPADEIEKRFAEGPMWIAEMESEAVGTVSLTTEPEGLYVRSMAVSPHAQGCGVGRRLLDAVTGHADASGCERMFLYTTYFVPGAIKMYEKHGFKWVRDTTAEEWYGTPGLEMERFSERKKRNVIGS